MRETIDVMDFAGYGIGIDKGHRERERRGGEGRRKV